MMRSPTVRSSPPSQIDPDIDDPQPKDIYQAGAMVVKSPPCIASSIGSSPGIVKRVYSVRITDLTWTSSHSSAPR